MTPTDKWRQIMTKWDRQHRFLVWYTAAVATIVLLLAIGAR